MAKLFIRPQENSHVAELRGALGRLFESMPRDLQQTMLSSPSRAALLQTLAVHPRIPGQPLRQGRVVSTDK